MTAGAVGATTRRSKVLVLVDKITDSAAGAERFAVGLAIQLSGDHHEVCVCASRKLEGRFAETLTEAGVSSFTLGRGDRFKPLAFLTLARFIRRSKIDVLHSHMFGSNVWAALVGKLCRVPVVVAHEHTWSYQGQPLRRFLDRHLIARFASTFVSVSRFDRDRMISIEKVPPEKVVVIPNAYVPRARTAGGGDLRAEIGVTASTPLVGTAAHFRPQKALHVLVDAFAVLIRGVPDAHLVMAGTGDCQEELEAQAAAAGLEDRVHFVGLREDVRAVLDALDVAAMSSDFEGTPSFVLECMAHGVPLVSTDVGGVADVLEADRSVMLVPPREPAALAAAVEALLRDPERAAAMAAAARERLEEFTIERVADRIDALYGRLLVGAPAAPSPAPGH